MSRDFRDTTLALSEYMMHTARKTHLFNRLNLRSQRPERMGKNRWREALSILDTCHYVPGSGQEMRMVERTVPSHRIFWVLCSLFLLASVTAPVPLEKAIGSEIEHNRTIDEAPRQKESGTPGLKVKRLRPPFGSDVHIVFTHMTRNDSLANEVACTNG